MTSKQRAYLISLAMKITPIHQIGKSGITDEFAASVRESLEARELIKISVLQNCMDDIHALAEEIAERSNAQVVQVIGRKIVLYKQAKPEKRKIELPK